MATGPAGFVLLLNPDAEIDAGTLAILIDALRADPSLAGVRPRVVNDIGDPGKAICCWNLETGGAAQDMSAASTTESFTPSLTTTSA